MQGSSKKHCSEVYRGPRAFSEPESRALRDFILARQISFYRLSKPRKLFKIHPNQAYVSFILARHITLNPLFQSWLFTLARVIHLLSWKGICPFVLYLRQSSLLLSFILAWVKYFYQSISSSSQTKGEMSKYLSTLPYIPIFLKTKPFRRKDIKMYLTLHSYGQMILYPWGYDRSAFKGCQYINPDSKLSLFIFIFNSSLSTSSQLPISWES